MNRTPANAVPEPETATEAAARWFALRRRKPDAIENQQFTDWLNADPAHQMAYDEVARSWEIAALASADPTVLTMRNEALMARPRDRGDPARLWGALATAALVVVAVTGVSLTNPDLIRGARDAAMQRDHFVLHTGIGERATASLEDGSTVTLNTNSTLRD